MPEINNFAEDLFEVIACYFPLSFRPRTDDPNAISRELLATSLVYEPRQPNDHRERMHTVLLTHCEGNVSLPRSCLSSSTLLAPFCIPFMIEKITLSTSSTQHKLESLKALHFCMDRFHVPTQDSSAIEPFLPAVWATLRELIFVADDATLLPAALEALIAISKTLAKGTYDPSAATPQPGTASSSSPSLSLSSGSSSSVALSPAALAAIAQQQEHERLLESFVAKMVGVECVHYLEDGVDEAACKQSIKLLRLLAESSLCACNKLLEHTLPIFERILSTQPSASSSSETDGDKMDVEKPAAAPSPAKQHQQSLTRGLLALRALLKLLHAAKLHTLVPAYPVVASFQSATQRLYGLLSSIATASQDDSAVARSPLAGSERARQYSLDALGVLVAVSHPHSRKNRYLSLEQCLEVMALLTNDALPLQDKTAAAAPTGSTTTAATAPKTTATSKSSCKSRSLSAIESIAASGNEDLVLQRTVPPLLALLSRIPIFASTQTAVDPTQLKSAMDLLRISSILCSHPAIFATIVPALLTLVRSLLLAPGMQGTLHSALAPSLNSASKPTHSLTLVCSRIDSRAANLQASLHRCRDAARIDGCHHCQQLPQCRVCSRGTRFDLPQPALVAASSSPAVSER